MKSLLEEKKVVFLFVLNFLILVLIIFLNIPFSAVAELRSFFKPDEIIDTQKSAFGSVVNSEQVEYEGYIISGAIKSEEEIKELLDNLYWSTDEEIADYVAVDVITQLQDTGELIDFAYFLYEGDSLKPEYVDSYFVQGFLGTVGTLTYMDRENNMVGLNVFYSPYLDLFEKNMNLTLKDEYSYKDFTFFSGEKLDNCAPLYFNTIKLSSIMDCLENGYYIATFCGGEICEEGDTVERIAIRE